MFKRWSIFNEGFIEEIYIKLMKITNQIL